MEQRTGPWFAVFYCAYCDNQLTHKQRMYSHATCPHCGVRSDLMATVCDTYTVSWRKVYTGYWWQWWKYWMEQGTSGRRRPFHEDFPKRR